MRRPNLPSRPAVTAGFTLIEVLVVLLLIGMIAVILAGLIPRQMVRIRAEGFADRAVSLLQATRGRAIRDNAQHTVEWVDEDGDTVLDALSGVTGLGAGTSEAVTLPLHEFGLTVYDAAPCLAATTDGKTHVAGPLIYDARGVADRLAAFCFTDPNGNVLQVAADSPSLMPKVRKLLPAVGKFSPAVWEWEWY